MIEGKTLIEDTVGYSSQRKSGRNKSRKEAWGRSSAVMVDEAETQRAVR